MQSNTKFLYCPEKEVCSFKYIFDFTIIIIIITSAPDLKMLESLINFSTSIL